MSNLAPALKPSPRGGYIARKWLPPDVREAYGKLYAKPRQKGARQEGPQWEAWFNSGPVGLLEAKALYRDWLNDVEAKIANIRAEREGKGRTLTPQGARALAGQWYAWFVLRMAANKWSADMWRAYRDRMWEGLYSVADGFPEPFDRRAMEHVRPIIADEAKTAQFLADKRAPLDSPSRDLFLDYVARDFFAALDRLLRQAEGDFGEDQHAKQFPTSTEIASDVTPWALFEKWIAEKRPATATVDRWRATFLKLQADFPHTSAAALLPEQAQAWAEGLVTKERSAVTVRDVWVIACRTVYAWAIGKKLVSRNPFKGWRITVPKKISTREHPEFTKAEISTILKAAMKVDVRSKATAAKRWVPWICAYTGARAGEITQLRGSDVFKEDDIWAVRISPEAGTVKNRKPRTVPVHPHLLDQGFLKFVKASGSGALFYNEPKPSKGEGAVADDPTNPKRPRAVKARERVAEWVREIGVDDPELQPNHAWRHTFKAIGFRCEMTEKMLDAICGHAQVSTGRTYGLPTLADKAEALRRFPRYKL